MTTRTRYTTGDLVDGRYAIVELIGSGGMAHVYRAHDEVLERDVALKVLHAHFASDKQFVQRFQREARAAARLSHPNLVPIYDSGSVDDTFYIAMELVTGETLFDLLQREQHLNEATLLPLADQALAALAYAHARGVVHRDLKPANLIIGDNDRLRVADFGIAHIATDATLTLAGSISGTPQYLSPEQARG
ncbi:MAG: serine/threonine protein kinase, partial [Thermoleophilia bacterium]|nr:serine/threonine protein kinase [Thermoleophilia bacterium]